MKPKTKKIVAASAGITLLVGGIAVNSNIDFDKKIDKSIDSLDLSIDSDEFNLNLDSQLDENSQKLKALSPETDEEISYSNLGC